MGTNQPVPTNRVVEIPNATGYEVGLPNSRQPNLRGFINLLLAFVTISVDISSSAKYNLSMKYEWDKNKASATILNMASHLKKPKRFSMIRFM
ncbi:hypothetical protein [Crenothrix polyspora]|uniref:Uncharacterized protein n=1 Tax=Crenothrix polyspora TaxID=360316 RepID=A0A1R4GZM9_9GAMM|nr:hypothetical protein [Crenothrix polyspora]SJM89049.1 hypothetical protein CRENPOLYSF1_10048 [Crenothrix polyspora]